MRRLYRTLLRLYPREHQLQFADEMLAVFARVAEQQRTEGRLAYARFAITECLGLLGGGLNEQRRRLNLAAPLGGVALATALQGGFYQISLKVLHAGASAVGSSTIASADEKANLALMVTLSLTWLLVSILLSIRLIRLRR